MTKKERLKFILQLIDEREIGTQEELTAALNAENVDSEFPANVQFTDAFSDPAFRHFRFKNCVLIIDFYVVEDMIGAVSDCSPLWRKKKKKTLFKKKIHKQ